MIDTPIRHCLSYAFDPNYKYIATEIQKIFKLLGAYDSKVSTKHVTIVNKDWSHTKGEITRHDVSGVWHNIDEMLLARKTVGTWLGGD